MFLSTHDLELALQVADRLWLMQTDGTLAIGSPRELADNGVLTRFIEEDSGVTFDTATLSIRIRKDAAE